MVKGTFFWAGLGLVCAITTHAQEGGPYDPKIVDVDAMQSTMQSGKQSNPEEPKTYVSSVDQMLDAKSPYLQWASRQEWAKMLESQLAEDEAQLAKLQEQNRRSGKQAKLKASIDYYQNILKQNQAKIDKLREHPDVIKVAGEPLKRIEPKKIEKIQVTEDRKPSLVVPDCKSAIKDYFAADANKDAVQKFLKIQGDLTTQRLAWAFLSQAEKDDSIKTVEGAILKLLKQKYGPGVEASSEFVGQGKAFADEGELKAFVSARDQFEKKNLSREALATVAPQVSDILEEQAKKQGTDAAPYLLADSDMKMLHLIATGESSSAQRNGTTINVVKIVNSSLQGKTLDKASAAVAKKDLEKKIKSLQSQLDASSKSMAAGISGCSLAESRSAMCKRQDGTPLSTDQLLRDCNEAMGAMYEGVALRSDGQDAVKFGKIWSRVKLADAVEPSRTTASQSPSGEPTRANFHEAMKSAVEDVMLQKSGPYSQFTSYRIQKCEFQLSWRNGERVIRPDATTRTQWSDAQNRFMDKPYASLPEFTEKQYRTNPAKYQQELSKFCYDNYK